jgi:chromosome partitioning protein
VNLAAALALDGQPTLLVDSVRRQRDHRTRHSRARSRRRRTSFSSPTMRRRRPRSRLEHLDVVAATRRRRGVELVTLSRREFRLRERLAPIAAPYAFTIIDCPPSLSLLTVNALTAADGVLVPLQAEYYALEGLTALLDTVGRVRDALNPSLALEGLVLTMFDGRNSLAQQVQHEVRMHFGDQVFRTVIPRNVRLSESPSHGLSVLEYDPRSRGAVAYRALARELASPRTHEVAAGDMDAR